MVIIFVFNSVKTEMQIEKVTNVAHKISGDVFSSRSRNTDVEKKILEPVSFIVQNRGKELRKRFLNVINYWIRAPQRTLDSLTPIFSPLHDLSLIADDIQDNSNIRRGLPCTHVIFGIPRTMSALSFAFMILFERAVNPGELEMKQKRLVCSVLLNKILELLRGQSMDVFWRETATCPTEEEYMKMVSQKTGTTFNTIFDILDVKHPQLEALQKLVSLLGPLFQIRDDYINLSNEQYMKKKGFCEDLEEGKFSFPIIHAVHSHPEDKTVLNIIKQSTKDEELKRYCLSILLRYNSLEYTKEKIHAMEEEIKRAMRLVGENPLIVEFFKELDLTHGSF